MIKIKKDRPRCYTGKVIFSRDEAEYLARKSDLLENSYPCDICGGWHTSKYREDLSFIPGYGVMADKIFEKIKEGRYHITSWILYPKIAWLKLTLYGVEYLVRMNFDTETFEYKILED